MIIDDIKVANANALRDQDDVARSVFSKVMNGHLLANIKIHGSNPKAKLRDLDTINILRKVRAQLDDSERCALEGLTSADVTRQKLIIEQYIPPMLTIEEIDDIIDGLEDKNVATVMRHFKKKYVGVVDLSLVNTVLKVRES